MELAEGQTVMLQTEAETVKANLGASVLLIHVIIQKQEQHVLTKNLLQQ